MGDLRVVSRIVLHRRSWPPGSSTGGHLDPGFFTWTLTRKHPRPAMPKSLAQSRASATSQAPAMNLVATTLRISLDVIKQHDHSLGGGPSGGCGTRGHGHLSQGHLTLLWPLLEMEASQLPTNLLPPNPVSQLEDHRQDHGCNQWQHLLGEKPQNFYLHRQ